MKLANLMLLLKFLGAIFNPADFLYKMFGKKPNEMQKAEKNERR